MHPFSVGIYVMILETCVLPVIPPSVKVCLKECKKKLDQHHVIEIN